MNYVGIDIGGTFIKAGLVDENGGIVKKSSVPTLATRKWERVMDDIVAQINRLTAGAGYAAVGVGSPGAIDSANGVVEYSPNLFWKDVPLAKYISGALGKTVKVGNDANVAALGEAKFGAGRDYSDVVMLTLGTGVGSGIVAGGRLFEGYRSMGAEIGHMVIREDGEPCGCGRRGCLEAYASATALVRDTLSAMQIAKNSLMWEECGNDLNKVDGRTSFAAAKRGDEAAKRVVAAYAKSLAEGIINIINIFRSQAIILGGGVCAQGDALLNPVREYVAKHRFGGSESLATDIITARLGGDAGVIGAACLVME
ncbi:MAG: ROK family protein [Clostridiales bacterium]|jgi:glucokinase|nr:ROK family protein [Clostridiales bacterium]